jgi:hypothetical protein
MLSLLLDFVILMSEETMVVKHLHVLVFKLERDTLDARLGVLSPEARGEQHVVIVLH